jgi:hypothetical protein
MIPIVFGTLEFLFKSGTVANLALVAWTIYTKVGNQRGWQVLEYATPIILKQLNEELPQWFKDRANFKRVEASLPYLLGAIKAWREVPRLGL